MIVSSLVYVHGFSHIVPPVAFPNNLCLSLEIENAQNHFRKSFLSADLVISDNLTQAKALSQCYSW